MAAFFLADHAEVVSGKVYTNGAFWNRLSFPSLPAVVHVGVVLVLNVPWRALNQKHRFAVWFEDADGGRIGGDLTGEFEAGSAPEMRAGDETIVPMSAILSNFTFEKAGEYSAVAAVDGHESARWKFKVFQIAPGFQLTAPGEASQSQN